MSNTFTAGSITLRYSRLYHNEAYANERSVEIALGDWFVRRRSPGNHPVIEVGCVLPYYWTTTHEVVDLADEHPASRRANALSLNYVGRDVLSISTVEHMQRAEYQNTSDEDSITFLRKVTAEAGHWLVTWGVGYNPVLDAWVKTSPLQRTFLKRTSWKNTYRQVPETEDVWSAPFGHSDRPIPEGWFNNANVVVVLTNVPELLEARS